LFGSLTTDTSEDVVGGADCGQQTVNHQNGGRHSPFSSFVVGGWTNFWTTGPPSAYKKNRRRRTALKGERLDEDDVLTVSTAQQQKNRACSPLCSISIGRQYHRRGHGWLFRKRTRLKFSTPSSVDGSRVQRDTTRNGFTNVDDLILIFTYYQSTHTRRTLQ